MHPLGFLAPFLCSFLILCLLPTAQGRPRALSKEERIASILAQKPMHTTALLAGAAMPTPSPYPPDASDLGYTQRPPLLGDDAEAFDENDDNEDDDNEWFQMELKR
ncbi:MAG: hypothetical protein Q9219_004410 [cf. Caloplaca sp. 3 TL-2023]